MSLSSCHSIREKEAKLRDEFSFFEKDAMGMLDHIMTWGELLQKFPEEERKRDNLLEGCISRAWLKLSCCKKIFFFEATSESRITKGILAIYQHLLHRQSCLAVYQCSDCILQRLGLEQLLSVQRREAVFSIGQKIKLFLKKEVDYKEKEHV